MVRDWRKHVHPELREHLEREIRGTFAYKKGYDDADNKGNAQLWIAVANLSKMINKLEKKLGEIENSVKEAEKVAKQDAAEEVSFIETPLMGGDEIKLPEMDEIRELVAPVSEELEEKALGKRVLGKRERKKAVVKKIKKAVKNKAVKTKKPSKVKKLKKSLKRF